MDPRIIYTLGTAQFVCAVCCGDACSELLDKDKAIHIENAR